jgi:hypothetical protein
MSSSKHHIRNPHGAVRMTAEPQVPAKGGHRSQAHGGIHPLNSFIHRTQQFEALPLPLGLPPYHLDLAPLYNDPAFGDLKSLTEKSGKLIFHVTGDTGGVKNGIPQTKVADAMAEDLQGQELDRPQFFYHLGDVVYFNGEHDQYYEQFYEPYGKYSAPIVSIPGNHDGDPVDQNTPSLDGWVRFFMTKEPSIDGESGDEPRLTMTQPNPYWTLITPFATIVGLYTNVPEHGSIDSVQQQWLTNEFATADKDKAFIVALHHPIYSFDDHHSGSSRMADVIQQAINDSRRVPNLVLTAHVHNYQRIEREIIAGTKTPFLVVGNGGYHNLHHLPKDSSQVQDDQTGAKLIYGDDKRYGYLTLTVDGEAIRGTQTAIDLKSDEPQKNQDTFVYSGKALFLAEGQIVNL